MLIPVSSPLNGICHDKCGNIWVKFPFGSSFGCGHPAFARYVKCSSSGTLEFSTGTNIYSISSIDYSSNILTISDPFMYTCSSMQNFGSFILDHASPFTVTFKGLYSCQEVTGLVSNQMHRYPLAVCMIQLLFLVPEIIWIFLSFIVRHILKYMVLEETRVIP